MREIAAEWPPPDYAAAAGVPGHRAAERAGRAGVLDISAMMNCSFERLAVSKVGLRLYRWIDGHRQVRHGESGWTRDGCTPNVWVYLRYFAVSANVLADFREACRPGVVR